LALAREAAEMNKLRQSAQPWLEKIVQEKSSLASLKRGVLHRRLLGGPAGHKCAFGVEWLSGLSVFHILMPSALG
jgi:hypothetical protein